jgi:hypothetical protein
MSRIEVAALFVAVVLFVACNDESRANQTPGCTLTSPPVRVDSNATTENVRAGRTYDCVFATGEPVVYVALVADTSANAISRIELRRERESAPFQTLTEGAEEPPFRGATFFDARDFDADGHLDLMLLTSWGVTGNTNHNVWRWTAGDRFVFDSTLSNLGSATPVDGRPCVAARSNGGHAGMIYARETVCLEQGRWVRTSLEDQRWEETLKAYVRETRERRGDSLVVTRVDTVRDTTR